MRGKVPASAVRSAAFGITPAHAGKRMSAKPCASRFQDHPRTCGEKWLTSGCWSPSQGSPPHMRGKVSKYAAKPADYRITPAHAGKSASLCSCAWLPGDHPRTCGEKSALPGPAIAVQGSPPHMRGKGIDRSAHTDKSGITPAHAGKSWCLSSGRWHLRDHPRTCGEKGNPHCEVESKRGSPPHMRGKVYADGSEKDSQRITPAHAGKSSRPS